MNVCTIVAKNYLAHARVLASSYRAHHPDATVVVLIVDELGGYVDPAVEPFVVVTPEDLELDRADFLEMQSAYDVLELSTALKPWLLEYMLDHHEDGTGVAYLDPDIQVHGPMVELAELLTDHDLVLTPHLTEPMPRDGKRPRETDILISGVYNLGFIALSATEETRAMLTWWAERLRTDCLRTVEDGLFVDQRWIDFVPGLVPGHAMLRLPTYNIAYWNVPTRTVAHDGDGYTVNGLPLRFFHFSGYSPDAPGQLSKYQNRVALGTHPTLRRLCDEYGDALRDAGYEDVRDLPYEPARTPSGMPLDTRLRAMFRKGIEDGELSAPLMTPAGEADFLAWLREPSEDWPPLNRYLASIYGERSDIQHAYSDLSDPEIHEGFIGWVRYYGPSAYAVPDELMPEGPGEVGGPASEDADAATADLGVNVAGYLRAELGVAEVARQIIGALDTTAVRALPVGLLAPNSRQGHAYAATDASNNPFLVNIVAVNADGLPAFAEEVGPAFFEDRYSIGVWAWELDAFPAGHEEAFALLDEVWVHSPFEAAAIAERSPVPVICMPVPIEVAATAPLAPGELGWPDAFTYLFSWDYNSVFERKNPLGTVAAYTRAFGPEDGAALVLKCINHARYPQQHDALLQAIADRPDIVLIDGYLSAEDKDRLAASCDCYVSLHRSEGLGLTMAEAMYVGKPVVATGYSGNLMFMTANNSFLVDHTFADVGPDAYPYPPDARWAEPDLEHAAELLRQVRDDPDEAARRGARAARDIRERHSPQAAGAAMERRLEQIHRRHAAPAAPSTTVTAATTTEDANDAVADEQLDWLVAREARPRTPAQLGRLGAAVRKATLRLMRPYTSYQHDVNTQLRDALRRSRSAQARQADRMGDLDASLGEALRDADMARTRDYVDLLAELRRQRSAHAQLAERVAANELAQDRGFAEPEREDAAPLPPHRKGS